MTYIPQDEARKMACPVAATQGDASGGKVNGKCRGEGCILWRWRPLDASDGRFWSAVKREQALMYLEHLSSAPEKPKSEASFHKAAVARVSGNIAGYVIRHDDEQGYCGLGDRP